MTTRYGYSMIYVEWCTPKSYPKKSGRNQRPSEISARYRHPETLHTPGNYAEVNQYP
jgi:hypothetical protein